MDDVVYAKLDRAAVLFQLFECVITDYKPGDYRFAERYPQENVEYCAIFTEFIDSNDLALARVGFRMKRLLLEINESDRTFQRGRPSRQSRKQLDLMYKALQQLEAAIVAFLEPGVIR